MEKKELQKIYQHLQTTMNEKLSDMERRLENLEQDFANLQEDSEVTRFSVNLLLDWAEDASIKTVPIHSRKEKDDAL